MSSNKIRGMRSRDAALNWLAANARISAKQRKVMTTATTGTQTVTSMNISPQVQYFDLTGSEQEEEESEGEEECSRSTANSSHTPVTYSSPAPATGSDRATVTYSTPAPATDSGPVPATDSSPAPATGSDRAAVTYPTPAPATDSSPEPATDSSPAPATGSDRATVTYPNPEPATDSGPMPATDSSPVPLTGSDRATATYPSPAPATDSSPVPATDSSPAPTTGPDQATATYPTPAPSTNSGPVPAPCPSCRRPFLWSDFAQGDYSAGWDCENMAKCGNGSLNCGPFRWFCEHCQVDVCRRCFELGDGSSSTVFPGSRKHVRFGTQEVVTFEVYGEMSKEYEELEDELYTVILPLRQWREKVGHPNMHVACCNHAGCLDTMREYAVDETDPEYAYELQRARKESEFKHSKAKTKTAGAHGGAPAGAHASAHAHGDGFALRG